MKSGEASATTTAAFSLFHFGVKGIWSWSPGVPRLDSLDSQGNQNIQDLELEKGEVRTGRTSSQTAAVTRDLPPVNQSFPAVNPPTSPCRALPHLSQSLDNAERVVFLEGEGASRFPVVHRSHHRQLLGLASSFSPPTIPGHQIGDSLFLAPFLLSFVSPPILLFH